MSQTSTESNGNLGDQPSGSDGPSSSNATSCSQSTSATSTGTTSDTTTSDSDYNDNDTSEQQNTCPLLREQLPRERLTADACDRSDPAKGSLSGLCSTSNQQKCDSQTSAEYLASRLANQVVDLPITDGDQERSLRLKPTSSKPETKQIDSTPTSKLSIRQSIISFLPQKPKSSKESSSLDQSTSASKTQGFLSCSNSSRPLSRYLDGSRLCDIKSATLDNKGHALTQSVSSRNSPVSRNETLSGLKRSSFSKSASGSRLISKNSRPNVCDCLASNCQEKEHSTRRRFIENYYNSRTRLPSTSAVSSFNVNTPISTLNECDAITKRLLSSPIRTPNPDHGSSSSLDRSRRASLGTGAGAANQVFLFATNQFNSLETDYKTCRERRELRGDVGGGVKGAEGRMDEEEEEEGKETHNNQLACDLATDTLTLGENDARFKQQGRSLSVCDEDTIKPRYKTSTFNHSSNLNRAVSLACEQGTSRRLLTIIPLFGCEIESLSKFAKLGLVLPPAIDSAIRCLLADGSDAVGIFRKSGVRSRIQAMRQRMEGNQDLKIEQLNKDNEFSIYDIADLVKMWFRELRPSPLLTEEMIKLISNYVNLFEDGGGSSGGGLDIADSIITERWKDNENSSQTTTTEVFGSSDAPNSRKLANEKLKERLRLMLTPTHRELFTQTISFFARISSNSETNQMTSQNLAICLTPSLCSTESAQSSLATAQKVLEYCIENHRILF